VWPKSSPRHAEAMHAKVIVWEAWGFQAYLEALAQ